MAERFLALIVTMLPAFREIEQRLDRETGRRFNAFNLFPPNENATSRILSFLLNPKEAHGQNDVFLRHFIQQFVPAWQGEFAYPNAHIASTSEPIDVIVSDGFHWLGIENKIFDAPEQLEQAKRYLDSLRDAPSQRDYRLVYLRPRGEPPSNYSLPAEASRMHVGRLILGAWGRVEGDPEKTAPASIPDWLVQCQNQCRAENVTWLIKQFASYVDSLNARQKEPDMVDAAIVGLALRDPQNLEAALRIGKSADEVRRKVLSAFLERVQFGLEEWIRQEDAAWEVLVTWPGGNWTERPEKKWLPLLLHKKTWPAMVGPAIQAEQNGPFEVFIGVCGRIEDKWGKTDTQLYGRPSILIGQDSRERIATEIGRGEPGQGFWVYTDSLLRDSGGKDISDWRDTATITRLFSEKEELSKHVTERMIELGRKMSNLDINAT